MSLIRSQVPGPLDYAGMSEMRSVAMTIGAYEIAFCDLFLYAPERPQFVHV
jgi:hypothetical protein